MRSIAGYSQNKIKKTIRQSYNDISYQFVLEDERLPKTFQKTKLQVVCVSLDDINYNYLVLMKDDNDVVHIYESNKVIEDLNDNEHNQILKSITTETDKRKVTMEEWVQSLLGYKFIGKYTDFLK